jgi:pyridoxamine 5'-phosphate oxidase
MPQSRERTETKIAIVPPPVSPPADPLQLFAELYAQARQRIPVDPNAMTVSTVGEGGRPSSRVVLLKEADPRGFTFYTNLESRKGREARPGSMVALCFFWRELERQVRIEGRVEQVPDAEADAYFATRQRGSQVGAWASRQSEVLTSREELDARVREIEQRFEGKAVSRPPFWSGLRVVPDRIEFWTSRPSRLHERLLYRRARPDAPWTVALLYP